VGGRRVAIGATKLATVRVLVFHGYLLRGTGSNVYNASLAAALVRLGHEVHLLCQERHACELEFVGAVGNWDAGELVLERIRAAGCTVYRPNIGRVLPVYVPDRYERFEARPFPELSDVQLDAYLQANVGAVSEVVARSNPDVALANHLVMGPAILARALSETGIPFAVKVHGSALEYTVKPHPRFLPYAREGLAAANGVLVGSRHTAASLWAALDDPSLPTRTRLGPPGVDLGTFRPAEPGAALARLRTVAEGIAHGTRQLGPAQHVRGSGRVGGQSAFGRDQAATARALADLVAGAEGDRLVAFVGKLIVSKGIDLLLVAWPLVLAEVPAARLGVVGFGAYRDAAERLIDALSAGDLETVRGLASAGRAAEGGRASRLGFVFSFLEWLSSSSERERYLAAARHMRERVVLTGRLEHDELAAVLPLCEAIVVPSTFPESFGMVAVEGAACGALPISAAHSGLEEVSRTLAKGLPEPVRKLVSFPLGPDAVQSIATRLIDWLCVPPKLRDSTRADLMKTVASRYSWEGVARGVIAAARGELDMLDLAT
jgi:glycosyltransferase involved in cell wall biosynthesis